MNRETLYSSAVFDLTEPVTIDAANDDGRFQSLLIINQKNFVKGVAYAPASFELTAASEADGSVVIHFGGDPDSPNYLYLPGGWKYLMRLYRPRQNVIDSTRTMPQLVPVGNQDARPHIPQSARTGRSILVSPSGDQAADRII
jgi:hypothetical protein